MSKGHKNQLEGVTAVKIRDKLSIKIKMMMDYNSLNKIINYQSSWI